MKKLKTPLLDRESFIIRALRLVERLNERCQDGGFDNEDLREWHTWNSDYSSDVKLLMGDVFEIMRLQNFVKEKGLNTTKT